MTAELRIGRDNIDPLLTALVAGSDPDDGFTLDKEVSFGPLSWRKGFAESPNSPGRTMTDYTRDVMTVSASIKCHGGDEVELQDRLAEVLEALWQVTADGFQPFNMTYLHGAATYKWKCTEPADVTIGEAGSVDDEEMAHFMQSVGFVIVRNPIPIEGPI